MESVELALGVTILSQVDWVLLADSTGAPVDALSVADTASLEDWVRVAEAVSQGT